VLLTYDGLTKGGKSINLNCDWFLNWRKVQLYFRNPTRLPDGWLRTQREYFCSPSSVSPATKQYLVVNYGSAALAASSCVLQREAMREAAKQYFYMSILTNTKLKHQYVFLLYPSY
jgi:hypothetical protein